jgi:hypothetical protein
MGGGGGAEEEEEESAAVKKKEMMMRMLMEEKGGESDAKEDNNNNEHSKAKGFGAAVVTSLKEMRGLLEGMHIQQDSTHRLMQLLLTENNELRWRQNERWVIIVGIIIIIVFHYNYYYNYHHQDATAGGDQVAGALRPPQADGDHADQAGRHRRAAERAAARAQALCSGV